MAIRALSPTGMRPVQLRTRDGSDHTDRAIEWFADDTGVILGAIAYDQCDLKWSFVVLGQDNHGTFRALHREAGLRVLDDARLLLIEKMAIALATAPLPAA
jgi:hypothetical protein